MAGNLKKKNTFLLSIFYYQDKNLIILHKIIKCSNLHYFIVYIKQFVKNYKNKDFFFCVQNLLEKKMNIQINY